MGQEKQNALLNLIKQYDDDDYSILDIIDLYFKKSNEAKYQYVNEKRKNIGLEQYKNLKTLLNTRMIWAIFTKIFKDTIQITNAKY